MKLEELLLRRKNGEFIPKPWETTALDVIAKAKAGRANLEAKNRRLARLAREVTERQALSETKNSVSIHTRFHDEMTRDELVRWAQKNLEGYHPARSKLGQWLNAHDGHEGSYRRIIDKDRDEILSTCIICEEKCRIDLSDPAVVKVTVEHYGDPTNRIHCPFCGAGLDQSDVIEAQRVDLYDYLQARSVPKIKTTVGCRFCGKSFVVGGFPDSNFVEGNSAAPIQGVYRNLPDKEAEALKAKMAQAYAAAQETCQCSQCCDHGYHAEHDPELEAFEADTSWLDDPPDEEDKEFAELIDYHNKQIEMAFPFSNPPNPGIARKVI